MKEIVFSIDRIGQAAAEFLEIVEGRTLIAFYGNLGAGKTTFIKAICSCLDVSDTVCSPTFTIVNEYCTAGGSPVYHFDFYRIERLQEAMDIGIEEYFYSGNLCLMEWPEKIEELLPEETVTVSIEAVSEDTRVLKIDV